MGVVPGAEDPDSAGLQPAGGRGIIPNFCFQMQNDRLTYAITMGMVRGSENHVFIVIVTKN